MEKGRLSRGEATSFGFKSSAARSSSASSHLPSVAASVTKETIEPLVIPALPKHGKKKEGKAINRFGFRPITPLSNKVADLQDETKLGERDDPVKRAHTPPARPGHRSPATAVPPLKGGLKLGFRGSGRTLTGGLKPDPLKLEITQLDQSPSLNQKFRQISQQKRPTDIALGPVRNKTFNLRDLDDNRAADRGGYLVGRVAESGRDGAQPLAAMTTSSTSVGSQGEEKHKRDLESNEKTEKDRMEDDESCGAEEMWGHGEAMALDEGLVCLDAIDQSPECMVGLRSVLLKIEDPTFASLAALSHSAMLEDERSPDSLTSPDLSSSPPSVEPLPPPPQLLKDSPGTPMSPTHGSNSCSSDARDRDFLIDDEIADQPGLVCCNTTHQGSHFTDIPPTEAMASLSEQISKVLASLNESPRPRDRDLERDRGSPSLGTLSPCDSLASDDLMADFEMTDPTNLNQLNEMEASVLSSELEMQRSQVVKEWNSILTAHPASDAKAKYQNYLTG